MKKILTLFMAALLSVGMMAATTLYLAPGVWETGGAKYAIYYWGGSSAASFTDYMTADGDYYKADVPDDCTDVIFLRLDPSGGITWGAEWNRVEIAREAGKNLLSVTGWGSEKYSTGTWSVYDPVVPVVPVVHTYTVAGSSVALLGSEWTSTDTNNDMELVDGLYTWSKSDVSLSAGTINFKVCQDHAWDNSWPAQDYDLSIAKSGKYDVTITFNESTKAVAANAELKEEEVVLPSIVLHGNFTGSWADTETFVEAGDKKTASVTINLEKGKYEFGVKVGGTWTSNGVAFTRENHEAAVVAASGNLTLDVDTKGDYTFTWTYETNTLSIEYPTYVPSLPVMKIAGAWNVKDEAWVLNEMIAATDEKTASYEVSLEKGVYEFKVIKDGAWKTKANGGDPYGLHRDWPGVANVKDDATENLQVTADKAGSYTFTWTFANDSIGITFPELITSAVIVTAPEHGTITVKNGEDAIGTTVTEGTVLTITAASKDEAAYEITNLRAYKTDDENTPVTITDGQLTMPAFPITIKADEAEVVYQTLYFVNRNDWANVYGYAYLDETHKLKAWPGDELTAEKDSLLGKSVHKFTFPAKYTKVIFNDGAENQTSDLTWNAATPYFCNGFWYATAEAVKLDNSAKFYIVGEIVDSWDLNNTVKSTEDTYVVENLDAGTYKFRISVDGTWNNTKGFTDLTQVADGLSAADDNNISFTLKEASNVTITYTGEVFTVTGNFYVRVPVYKDLLFVPGDWAEDDAKMAAWIYTKKEGHEMEDQWTAFFAPKSAGNDTLKVQLDSEADSIVFVRFNKTAEAPSWEEKEDFRWNSLAATLIDYESLTYTITDWNAGTWEEYIPAKYYITGDSALVVDAGLDKAKAWNAEAIKAIEDTYTIKNLKAGQFYYLKVTDGKAWKGYTDLSTKALGLRTDGDNNIIFRLAEAGDVTVTYTGETFTLAGDFAMPVIAIAGNINGWTPAAMTVAPNKLTASITIENLTAATDSFKVVVDGDWRSLNGEGEGCYTFHRGWTGAKNINGGTRNMLLNRDKAGAYTFTWTYANDSLHIAFPELVTSAVSVTAPAHGTITVKNGEAAIGETVTEGTVLTITAAANDVNAYEITNLRAYKTDDEKTVVTITNGQLTMPAFPITIKADEAEVVYQTLYFVNRADWENVYAYAYVEAGNEYKAWPGDKLTAEKDSILGKSVHKFSFPAKYPLVIFSNGVSGEGNQTADLGWDKAEPYYCNGFWYATAEAVQLDNDVKYYVVGDKDILGNWNLDNAKKVSTDSYTFENLAAGTYKFRISLDGTWDNTKGYSDLTVKNANLFGADDNNITFTLDKATDVTITYTNEVFKLEGDFAVPAIAVACSANEGSWENPLAFTVANDKKTAYYTFENLAAGDYQFKIVCNGVWLSLPASEDGLYTFHRGWTGAKDLIINMELDMKFHADLAGNYTITWVFANDSIYFTYPALPTYAVTIANPANGTISVKNGDDAVASGAELLAGTVLTVAATPDSGYEISNLRAYKTDDENTPVAITDGQLSMPAFPITITADAERIALFTITGNAALVGEEKAWIAEKAIKVYENSYTFENLAAGEYQLKVIVNGEWKGYGLLTDKPEGIITDVDDNICFTLAEAGNVVVTHTAEVFTVEGNFYIVPDPSVIFRGSHAVNWNNPLNIEAGKFAEAIAGQRIVVTYKGATDGIEFKANGNHMAGSREAAYISASGTYEQYLTAKAVEEIKAYGLEIVGNNFTVTKVQLLNGKEPKAGTSVWTGYFWADSWSTLELYKEGYNYVDFSNIAAVRFYTEAAGTDYVLNFMKGWGEGDKFADQTNMTNGEGYKELVLTDELRTKLAEADHWMIQFNKEGLSAFNVTDIVLVEKPKYYLVGTFNNWTPAEQYLFAEDTKKEGEFVLADVALALNDELKVVKVEDGVKTWYPEGDNYVVDFEYVGEHKSVRVRPEAKTEEGWFEGCIYIEAVPVPNQTLYFVNDPDWENVYGFAFIGNRSFVAWPGDQLAKTGEKVAGKDIYSYTFPSCYVKVIFNNGGAGEGSQTADLAWTAAKPYYYDGVWYESVEAIIPGVPAKYYITGDAALVGAGTPWAANAIKVIEDSYTFENLAAGTYQLQINLEGVQDGTWKGYSDLTATADGLYTDEANNIIFTLAKAGNVTVTYNATTFTLTGNFYEPVLTDGYYLIGQNGWDVSALNADLLFKASATVEGEYELDVTLVEGQNLKVVSVVRDVILIWYPAGDGNNYVVDAAHAGEKTVYFRPAGSETWAEFGGYIYIKQNETTATDQATDGIKAVKTLENGMIIIRLGDKTYNAQGQLIR